MKVSLNQAVYYRNSNYNNQNSTRIMVQENPLSEPLSAPVMSYANFPNISFHANPDMEFLLKQADKLKCAYSGRDMISPHVARNIYQGLLKRPNAQSAINLLNHYQKFMHDIETEIFDLFRDASYKGKKTFQDILIELKPEALERLEEKQIKIINSADKYIAKMSDPIAEQVREIKDQALENIKNETFNRKTPLRAIKKIHATGKDLEAVIKVYQAWYKLPSSTKDIDAFIVKYAKEPHYNIAKRLISTAVATVEHVQPSSRSGDDKLGNFLLVSAEFNNNRHSMPLSDVDIKSNLQRYIEDVISEVHDKRSPFSDYSWYPSKIEETIATETAGEVHLDTAKLRISKAQKRENNLSEKLSKKYNVISK